MKFDGKKCYLKIGYKEFINEVNFPMELNKWVHIVVAPNEKVYLNGKEIKSE